MILRYDADSPEAPGQTGMPGCDSHADTNFNGTNSNSPWANDPGNHAGCGCASHPASGPALGLLLIGLMLLGLRLRRTR